MSDPDWAYFETINDEISDPDLLIEVIMFIQLQEKISMILSKINPRDAEILRMRFGINKEKSYTLHEIALKFGFDTRERVRQLEKRGMEKLRNPKYGYNQILLEFY